MRPTANTQSTLACSGKLSIAVAEAMPAHHYGFRPHAESMTFGELISHIARTNYQFCAGLKDSAGPATTSPADKDGVVKFLKDSFEYCSAVIPNLTEEQLSQAHNSPTDVCRGARCCSRCTFT
jgi:hypothetical protein